MTGTSGTDEHMFVYFASGYRADLPITASGLARSRSDGIHAARPGPGAACHSTARSLVAVRGAATRYDHDRVPVCCRISRSPRLDRPCARSSSPGCQWAATGVLPSGWRTSGFSPRPSGGSRSNGSFSFHFPVGQGAGSKCSPHCSTASMRCSSPLLLQCGPLTRGSCRHGRRIGARCSSCSTGMVVGASPVISVAG